MSTPSNASGDAARPRGLDPISMLAAATFLVWADRQMVAPVLPAMARDLHAGIAQVAAVVSVYSLTYGLFEIAYGQLADRFGRIRVMAIAMQVFGLGTLAAGLTPTLGGIIALRGVTGAAAAAIVPLSLTYIGDTVRVSRRQAAIGRINTANALGQALSVALGGLVAQVASWRALFVLYGVAASAGAFLLRRAPESVPGRRGEPVVGSFARILRTPGVPLLYLIGALEGGTIMGAFVYLSPQLKGVGYSYIVVGLVMASFGVVVLGCTRFIGGLVRRFSPAAPLWLGGSGIAAGYLAVALAPGLASGVACSALLGLAYAWFHSGMQTWATQACPDARATAVSGYAFALFVGAGLATQLLAPLAAAGDYRLLFLSAAAAGAAITVAGAIAGGRRHGREAGTSGA